MSGPLLPAGPEVAAAVPSGEYARLLGWPRRRALGGDLAARAEEARRWYAAHGRPFVAARLLAREATHGFSCPSLRRRLEEGEAHALLALAASAGAEVDAEVDRRWAEGRPDEAFFLDRFAAAVAEHLVRTASVQGCRAAEAEGETLLTHLSPGCGGWDLADQPRLMRALFGDGPTGPLRLLDSGALAPRASVLAALGIARRPVQAAAPDHACRVCDHPRCAFRRAPHAGMRARTA
jgi:hypothetical protein